MIKGYLSENRKRFNKNTLYTGNRKFFSAISFSQFKITLPIIIENVKGNLIDIGCGDLYYKQYVNGLVGKYDSIDFKKNRGDITFIGDIQNMEMIEKNRYDSAICLEVLEHISNPLKALAEINRILKPDAMLIISVPHLSRLHEVPYDFYRYTKFGLEYMLEYSGFETIEIKERGGLFSFLSHQVSTLLITTTTRLPIINIITYFFNKYFLVIPSYFLDLFLKTNKRLPAGYTILARKKF